MYVAEHHRERSETVVLLHAGVMAGWMWDEHLAALSGYHLLVPDLPGFGRSADTDWSSAAETAALCAEVIRARAHGGRAHVAGLSLGASAGLWLVAHPDRLVRSALLSGITARPGGRAARVRDAALLAVWHRRWFWQAAHRFGPFPRGDRDRFVRTALRISSTSQRQVFDEDARALRPERLRAVGIDVLLLAGSNEPRAIRDGLADLHAELPAARAASVPGAGHLWPVSHPRLFDATLLTWLGHHALHPHLHER